jgi:hypothetical protein
MVVLKLLNSGSALTLTVAFFEFTSSLCHRTFVCAASQTRILSPALPPGLGLTLNLRASVSVDSYTLTKKII